MRRFILTVCCAAAAAIAAAPAYGQTWPYALQLPNKQPASASNSRSEPPIETSIPVAVQPPAARPEVVAPKAAAPRAVAQQKIVRRPSQGPAGPVTMPTAEALVMMVRAAVAAVNQANFTENYSVLHAMATPALQARVSAAQFGRAFAGLRQQNLDLSPALVLNPEFKTAPALTPQGVLRLAGIFPSRPMQIDFAIDYRAVDGAWMIEALSVSAVPAGAAAPVAKSAPAVNATPVADTAATAPAAGASAMQSAQPLLRFVPANERAGTPLAFAPPEQRQERSSSNRSPAMGGPYVPAAYVQVAAKRDEAEAQAVLRSMQATFPQIFVNRQTLVKRADLGSKGVYYRAQIGPFSAEQARRECDNLKASGGQCFVQYE